MAQRPILEYPDPRLRERSTPVETFDDALGRLIDDLIDTMRDANGAGIAAPQVGSGLRIAVAEVTPATANRRYPYKPPIPLTVMVNPTLRPVTDEEVVVNEGCLSVPDLRGEVRRHVSVEVRFGDRDGGDHVATYHGLTAGTFQHECDHLDGVVYVDRVQNPTTFTTWANYERFHREAFERRITAFVDRVGS